MFKLWVEWSGIVEIGWIMPLVVGASAVSHWSLCLRLLPVWPAHAAGMVHYHAAIMFVSTLVDEPSWKWCASICNHAKMTNASKGWSYWAATRIYPVGATILPQKNLVHKFSQGFFKAQQKIIQVFQLLALHSISSGWLSAKWCFQINPYVIVPGQLIVKMLTLQENCLSISMSTIYLYFSGEVAWRH